MLFGFLRCFYSLIFEGVEEWGLFGVSHLLGFLVFEVLAKVCLPQGVAKVVIFASAGGFGFRS